VPPKISIPSSQLRFTRPRLVTDLIFSDRIPIPRSRTKTDRIPHSIPLGGFGSPIRSDPISDLHPIRHKPDPPTLSPHWDPVITIIYTIDLNITIFNLLYSVYFIIYILGVLRYRVDCRLLLFFCTTTRDYAINGLLSSSVLMTCLRQKYTLSVVFVNIPSKQMPISHHVVVHYTASDI
jgi:hypothetical protein